MQIEVRAMEYLLVLLPQVLFHRKRQLRSLRSSEVPRGRRFDMLPSLIERFDHLLGEGTLIQLCQRLFQLSNCRCTHDNSVLGLESGMVTHPAECRFKESQVVGAGDLCERLDSLEVRLCPVFLAEPNRETG